ncbi:MAG: hypothetical protein WCO84_01655 [bacterium]
MNILTQASEVEILLKDYNKRYDSEHVINFLTKSYYAKSNLRKIFEKHENWNEEAQAVIGFYEWLPKIDCQKYFRMINNCEFIPTDIKYFLRNISLSPIIENEEHLNYYCRYNNLETKAKSGQKLTRFLTALFSELDLKNAMGTREELNNYTGKIKTINVYEKWFVELSETFNMKRIKMNCSVSIHPMDFLNMSNGNSWSSCHNLEDGGWQAGTMSYSLDEYSFIFTVYDNKNGEKSYNCPKFARQIFAYSEGKILQSRFYPAKSEYRGEYELISDIVKDIINVGEGYNGSWTRKDNTVFKMSNKSLGYNDVYHSENEVMLHVAEFIECNDTINICNQNAYCLHCGNKLEETNSLTCEYCNNCTCFHCGSEESEENMYYNEGNNELYCGDCIRYCDDCGELLFEGWNIEYLDDMTLCCNCINNYFECEECNCIVHVNDLYYDDYSDRSLCGYCYDRIQETNENK